MVSECFSNSQGLDVWDPGRLDDSGCVKSKALWGSTVVSFISGVSRFCIKRKMGGGMTNQGLRLEVTGGWLYGKPADVVRGERFPSAGEQQACTSDTGNCGAERSGLLATARRAHPGQVSAASTAVSWAALAPGCVCGGQGWRWRSWGRETGSHLLPLEALRSWIPPW